MRNERLTSRLCVDCLSFQFGPSYVIVDSYKRRRTAHGLKLENIDKMSYIECETVQNLCLPAH